MFNNFLYFDIETTSNYKSYDDFVTADQRGSSMFLKKFKTTTYFKDTTDINEAYIKYGSLLSTYGKIVCISVGYYDKSGIKKIKTIHNNDEKIMLEDFSNLLISVEKKNFLLSGYGILNFDIPWVVRKMIKYNIKIPKIIDFNFKKPWELAIYDILENFKMKSTYVSTLDEVCYELGIPTPKDEIDGSMVHDFYWIGAIDSIIKYCEKDVKSNMLICEKIFNKNEE